MKRMTSFVVLLGLLLAQALGQTTTQPAPAQKTKETKPATEPSTTHGFVEFGVRAVIGDVYGRPDLPFSPSLRYSKMNEYRDIRNGFFIRNARIDMDDLFGTNTYLNFQASKAIYRDQAYLLSVGSWGKYKLQLRYDQTPHVFSNTARTIFTRSAPGVYTVPLPLRQQLQTLAAQTAGCPAGTSTGCNLPLTLEQTESQMTFFVPELDRRAGRIAFNYAFTPEIEAFASYRREHMSGTRPLGQIINSSPSASLTGGYGVELPEPIDYFTNDIRTGMEFGRERWGFQVAYQGSIFQNNIDTMTFDNPFRTTDCVAACSAATQGPATGMADLYPSNRADYFSFAGIFNLAERTNLMASITPGWLRQNDPFVPYTTNSLRLGSTGPLPAASLQGEKQTLAMTYTLASNIFKNFEIKAQYRHYDYNNNTPDLAFTPVMGDFAAPTAPAENRKPSYNRKNFELTGNYLIGKNSSIKAGYVGEWMDRSRRDVEHSRENGFIAGVDVKPWKPIAFNATYRYSVRDPEAYDDEEFTSINGGITDAQVFSRRFDQTGRIRNRLDTSLSVDATDRISFSVFAASTQDDYNRQGGANSPTALNFVPANYVPYYLYGMLKDLSWFWGADANFAVSNSVSFFAEYQHERYYRSMTSRNRTPGNGIAAGVLVASNCGQTNAPCDSPNNDWASASRDKVDSGTIGFDLNPHKKAFFSAYYTLSAGTGLISTRPLGDATLLTNAPTNPNKFILIGTNSATDYPMTVNRQHELGTIFRFKINERFQPKFEYRFQQWDNKDYQTTPMTPYMGCFSPIPNGPPVTNSVPGCTNPILLTNTVNPGGTASAFYPYLAVGDTSAARYLFLGADQPSYRSHYFAATLEFHF